MPKLNRASIFHNYKLVIAFSMVTFEKIIILNSTRYNIFIIVKVIYIHFICKTKIVSFPEHFISKY